MSQSDGSLALRKTHDLAPILGCLECTHPLLPWGSQELAAEGEGGG